MSKLKIYDSMRGKKVLFEPIDPKNIGHACGPTVYDYAHIEMLEWLLYLILWSDY